VERRTLRRAIAAAALLGVVTAGAWRATRRAPGGAPPVVKPVDRVIPAGTRVKVEVFNGTDTRGLARVAAGVLRDAGFDVVGFGNTAERHDSTVVRDRSGHPDWAGAAARVMGPAQVEVRADSGRLVDLTVVIGARWRPPTEPLRP
jgi:hypothetical protein